MSEQKAEYLGEVPESIEHEIRDEAPHDYFTMIPHLVEELDLTPYAFRLYAHLKRVTGENKEGKCWKSTKTLANACRMSAGAISNAKKELENTYPPLVRIKSMKKENGIYHEITIIDIWKTNHDLGIGTPVHLVKTPRQPSCDETPPSPSEPPRSCGETKKSTVKKSTVKNNENNNFLPSKGRALSKETQSKIKDNLQWQVLAGEKVESLPDPSIKEALDTFERDLKFNPLPWSTNTPWTRLEKFVLKQFAPNKNIFKRYNDWRNNEGKFEGMSNKQIYSNPDQFIATWPFHEVERPIQKTVEKEDETKYVNLTEWRKEHGK
jgi:hypothetical protein